MKTAAASMKRWEVEHEYEFKKWINEIPALHFKNEWEVYVIPPFAGAIARFRIEYKGKFVSCYLDCYDELGYFGEPYWEIYPYKDDVFRCKMNNTELLMQKIDDILEGKDLEESEEEKDE